MGMNYEGGYTVNDLFERQVSNLTLFPSDRLAVRVNPSGVVMVKATIRDISASVKNPQSLNVFKDSVRSDTPDRTTFSTE